MRECAGLKEIWGRAAIPLKSDLSITAHMIKLHEEWRKLYKKHNSNSASDVKKREKFSETLDSILDVGSPMAVKMIERSKEAKTSDIDFYLDQKGPRLGYMSGLDKKYSNAVKNKEKRETAFHLQKQAETNTEETQSKKESDIEDNELEVCVNEKHELRGDDFVVPPKRVKNRTSFHFLLLGR